VRDIGLDEGCQEAAKEYEVGDRGEEADGEDKEDGQQLHRGAKSLGEEGGKKGGRKG